MQRERKRTGRNTNGVDGRKCEDKEHENTNNVKAEYKQRECRENGKEEGWRLLKAEDCRLSYQENE